MPKQFFAVLWQYGIPPGELRGPFEDQPSASTWGVRRAAEINAKQSGFQPAVNCVVLELQAP